MRRFSSVVLFAIAVFAFAMCTARAALAQEIFKSSACPMISGLAPDQLAEQDRQTRLIMRDPVVEVFNAVAMAVPTDITYATTSNGASSSSSGSSSSSSPSAQGVVIVHFPDAGTYRVVAQWTPFIFAEVQYNAGKAQDVTVPLDPGAVMLRSVVLQVVDANNRPVPGATLLFPGVVPDVDPFDAVTDEHGTYTIYCMSRTRENGGAVTQLPVLVDAPAGSFCGNVSVTESKPKKPYTIRLSSPSLCPFN